jgi:5-methylcytosine-specific restriction endonuclease McrBC regulatory subunit McrC
VDEIVCGEIGTDGAGRWSEPLRLSPEDSSAVEALEGEGLLATRAEAGGLSLAGIDHVGTLTLPSGRRVQVRAKVGDVVLLDWLAYLGDAPHVPSRSASECYVARGGFAALIARQFLDELELLTGRTPRAAFERQRQDSSTVRGRILTGALARSFHRFPAMPQSRRRRTLDTPHHRLLAAALDRAAGLAGGGEDESRRTGSLKAEWSQFSQPSADLAATLAACGSECPAGYAAAVRLASLILLGASPAATASVRGAALLVPLADVWERALRRMCREIAPATGWRPVADSARTKRWDDGPGLRDPTRWMTADVILEAASRRWVLDAKYKLGYGDEARNDRFQMTAYAMAFNARRATLVYPTADPPRARWRLLLAGQIGGQPTTIDSIELPMSAGPVGCRAALLDAMLSLAPPAVKPPAVKPRSGPAILPVP